MTTALFDVIDAMVLAMGAVPALAGRVQDEGTLPMDINQLPQVRVTPRRVARGALMGEMEARESLVIVTVRAAGVKPGRAAHELLAQTHRALMTDTELNNGSVQIDLGTETFRFVDTEESVCDLQAEYQITFEQGRESLFAL